jgi:UDP-glucose 4-epimerase
MNVLVTGGAGFIGSHVCVKLLILGHKVIVLDNLCNSQINALQGVSKITNIDLEFEFKKEAQFIFYKGDTRNSDDLRIVFSNQRVDSVIHLAGLKSVHFSIQNPHKYFENNVEGTKNLVDIMKNFNCKSIIFSSSATVYGDSNISPIKENSIISPTNPYGENKFLIELFLKKIFDSDQSWRVAILRFFNPVGAHQSGIIGENPSDIPNNLMPYILKVANNELKVLKVYGNNYDTHDGTGIRDYIHVMDLADGHIKALNVLMKKPQIFTVNLGTGIGYSVLEVVKAFEKVSRKIINLEIISRREGDVAISYSDSNYAKELIGWEAQYNLEEMCCDSWNYLHKNKNNFN